MHVLSFVTKKTFYFELFVSYLIQILLVFDLLRGSLLALFLLLGPNILFDLVKVLPSREFKFYFFRSWLHRRLNVLYRFAFFYLKVPHLFGNLNL